MRILFIGHTRIGDAVLSTGVLQALADWHAGSRVTVVCGAVAAPLFAPAPFVERVLPVMKRRHSMHWVGVWRDVVGTRWDLVVDLRHSAIPWLIRAGRRLVRSGGDEASEHRVVSLARVLGRQDNPPAPHLWTTPVQDAGAASLVPDGSPVLALGPTANWNGKIWPAERFATLVARLADPSSGGVPAGARVAVFGGPGERDLAQPVLDSVDPARRIDLVGAADLPTIHACLRRCTMFVGNDSGLMHMAAASGIPTIGLFGPSQPEHYAPWGDRTAAVRTRLSYEELVGGPGYDHRNTDTLMESLEVGDVEDAMATLLDTPAMATTG